MPQPAPTSDRTHLTRFSIRRRTIGSAIGLCALGAMCALVVSACGSGSASPSSTTSSTTSAVSTTPTTSGSFAAYQSCLKKHGVNFAGAGFGGGGATGAPPAGTTGGGTRPTLTAAQQKALSACQSLRPSGAAGGPGGFGGGGANANNPAFAKFQACLKNHGVQTGSTNPQTSTSSQAAFAACRSLLPNGGAGGGFGSGSGSSAGGSGGANSATFAKYQTCLKQHGVQTGASGQSAAKLQAAITACRSLLPNNGTSGTTTATTTTNG
jgi:hypothetical protein